MQNIADKVVNEKGIRSPIFAVAILLAAIMMTFAVTASAQKSRASVSGAEVTGTFSRSFGAKYRNSASEIRISALGKGKLRIAFDLVYPYILGSGDLSANLGEARGEAAINGDVAVFESKEFGPCKITIKFT